MSQADVDTGTCTLPAFSEEVVCPFHHEFASPPRVVVQRIDNQVKDPVITAVTTTDFTMRFWSLPTADAHYAYIAVSG